MQEEHFCVCAGWLPGNVLPGSSGNVLVRSLAAGITLMSRCSCLVLWYVALCFIGFACAGIPYALRGSLLWLLQKGW